MACGVNAGNGEPKATVVIVVDDMSYGPEYCQSCVRIHGILNPIFLITPTLTTHRKADHTTQPST
jgi:hypothetical protein